MSLRKFISGVTAFAVAATAFAAMAVTASADNYSVTRAVYASSVSSNITNHNDGRYTSNNSNLGAVIADLTGLQGIANATSVTVEFETQVPMVNYKGGSYIAPVMFGVGDIGVRGSNGNGSTKTNYVKDGLVTYFGSENGTAWYLHDAGNNYASSVGDLTISAIVTLNRETGAYTATLKATGFPDQIDSGTTTVGRNLTVIEATTRSLPDPYTFTFKNITVSYTVPTPLTAATWTLNDGAEGYTDEIENDNVIKNGNYSIYGYYADITGNGITYTVKADLYSEVPATNQEAALGLTVGRLSGTGGATAYFITNAPLDLSTGKSRIYCE